MTTRTPTDFRTIRPTPDHTEPQFEARTGGSRRRPPQAADSPAQRPRRRRQPPPIKRRSRLRRFGFWILTIAVILGAGIGGVLFVINPAELVRTELARQVKANTGRELTIGGAPTLSFYPSVAVSLPNIAVSSPPGMDGGPVIQAEGIRVSVAFLPLVRRKVILEDLTLVRPMINLRVDQNGRSNWQVAEQVGRTRYARTSHQISDAESDLSDQTVTDSNSGELGLGGLKGLELRTVRIFDGQVRYSDERSGKISRLDDVNVSLAGQQITDPIQIDGSLDWNSRRLDVSGRLTTLRSLLLNKPAGTTLTLQDKSGRITFEGQITLANGFAARGTTQIVAPSFSEFVQLASVQLPHGAPIGKLNVSGDLNASSRAVVLSRAKIALGQGQASGKIAIAFQMERPKVTADLNVMDFDIDRFLGHVSNAKPIPPQPGLSQTGPSSRSPQSIEELLRGTSGEERGAGRFSPEVRGYTKRDGWGTEPIDSAQLRAIDANAKLTVSRIRIAGIDIDQANIRTTLADGVARAEFDDIQLYGGRGRSLVTARNEGSQIHVGISLSASDVSARPLLADASGLDMIEGKGKLTLTLGGKGATEKDIVSSLAGQATFVFNDGAIVGWNVPQILRGLQAGQISDLSKTATEKTDFSELSATFAVNRGVANTQDLTMTSPLIRLVGSGNTNLGKRHLDMILRPKLVASLAGQGGQRDLTGLEVPVRITGKWHDPKVTPDLSGILSEPDKVVETINAIGKSFKGKNAKQILNQLLGGAKGTEQGGNDARSMLKGLFKN
ncbi:MAG: AsmA family protein [Hyphomicrobiaceae bacterium]